MKGYDQFYEEPNDVAEHTCLVCGTVCEAVRERMGPRGHIEAMSNSSALHDYFYCPHGGKEWHEQARELLQAIEEMPSKRVAALMKLDLEDILVEHGIRDRDDQG